MIEKVGLDLNALATIQPPNITINQTAAAILQELPRTANDLTGGALPYLVLFTMFVITYWLLADKTPFGDFRYSDLRAMSLAFGITASVGLVQVSIGFIESWMAVVFCILSFLLSNVALIIVENKQ